MPPFAIVGPSAPAAPTGSASRTDQLRRQSQDLEAAFLAEMLSFAGLGEDTSGGPDSFSGGIGEAQFASFLRQEQAKLMVQHGGIGLAEQIFHSLVKGQGNGGL